MKSKLTNSIADSTSYHGPEVLGFKRRFGHICPLENLGFYKLEARRNFEIRNPQFSLCSMTTVFLFLYTIEIFCKCKYNLASFGIHIRLF